MTGYYLIIGRSSAGKSTYARKLLEAHLENGKLAAIIDGDCVRNLYSNQDYSDVGRWNNINSCIILAKYYIEVGIMPILALVCPKEEYRRYIMTELGEEGRFIYLEGGTLWEGTTFEEPDKEKWETIPDWRI